MNVKKPMNNLVLFDGHKGRGKRWLMKGLGSLKVGCKFLGARRHHPQPS